ncbi:MAG TPA: tail fiber protein [Pseudolabrys sp.]|nr:tail fiber protein [Pseudolabrys sp.]
MAETLTANYSWTKPDPGASANTWGATLNADLDKIDAQMFDNQGTAAQGGVPIGSGALWFAATPPPNWLVCNGSSLDTTTYAALFAAIGYTYGGSGASFNLPNLIGKFPLGGGALGATGGEASHVLTPAEMPIHTHGVVDPTHSHGVSDPTHAHGVNQSPHAHGVNDPQHAHAVAVASLVSTPGLSGGQQASLQPGSTSAAATGVSIQAANANVSVAAAGTGIAIGAHATGVTIQSAGGGAAHNTMPPYLQVSFIIKYQ